MVCCKLFGGGGLKKTGWVGGLTRIVKQVFQEGKAVQSKIAEGKNNGRSLGWSSGLRSTRTNNAGVKNVRFERFGKEGMTGTK